MMFYFLVSVLMCLEIVCGNITETSPDTLVIQPLVYHGQVTLPSSVPWHVGIYEPKGVVYDHVCGGTLISPNLIVTAAHCFWDFTRNPEKPKANLTHYTVALGKIYREWDLDNTNPNVQRLGVREIILDPGFDGYKNRFLANDIALVMLTRNAILTEYVRPADIDRNPGPPANGSIGMVAGWGYNELGIRSNELRVIELPYVDQDSCYKSLGEDRHKKLLSSDKFCAGFKNQKKGVCPGDSGGGFVVRDSLTNKVTVRGVLSLDIRPQRVSQTACYAENYSAYTNIGMARYLDWIHRFEGPLPHCPVAKISESITSSAVSVHYCHKDNAEVPCNRPVSVGTNAVLRCNPGYHFRSNDTSVHVTCQWDGNWTKPSDMCLQSSPCLPSPCGPNTVCRVNNGFATCTCAATYHGDVASLLGCRRECESSDECAATLSCVGFKCVDPCTRRCGERAVCRVVDHVPTCTCPVRHTGDPLIACREDPNGLCCPHRGSILDSTKCGDCTISPAFQCCATGKCNLFCCQCGGHCREGTCGRRRRDLSLFLGAAASSRIQESPAVTVHDIVRSADKDQDGRLSYEEAVTYLGPRQDIMVAVEKLDLDKDGFLTAEEIG